MESFTNKLLKWFKSKRSLPVVTEQSLVVEIARIHPRTWILLDTKYGIKQSELAPELTLSQLCKKFDLPPAQVLFMEIQLDSSLSPVEEITATEAQHLIQTEKDIAVLDVRESWERKFGSLPQSLALDGSLLQSIQKSWSKERPLLFYCHFGVRSKDAAHFFVTEGFSKVFVLKGGIDAWSIQIDPTVTRYTGAYC